MNHNFFGEISNNEQIEIPYQGRIIDVKIRALNDNGNSESNLDKLASQLQELGKLDEKARSHLIKSIESDHYFIENLFSNIIEDWPHPDTKLHDFYEKYEDDIVNILAEEFVSTLEIAEIFLYVDEPEDEEYAHEADGISAYRSEQVAGNDDIHIGLRYWVEGDGNDGLFWEWELLVLFNREGEFMKSYFGRVSGF